MDVGFEFLIPFNAELPTLKFEQPVYVLEEKSYPQGNEEFWFLGFKLIKSNIPEHIIGLLPKRFQNEHWQCISIIDGIDDIISIYSENINTRQGYNTLLKLLTSITGIEKKWVLVFEPDYDGIDEVLEGDVEIAFSQIVNSLTIEKTGFVIWYENKI